MKLLYLPRPATAPVEDVRGTYGPQACPVGGTCLSRAENPHRSCAPTPPHVACVCSARVPCEYARFVRGYWTPDLPRCRLCRACAARDTRRTRSAPLYAWQSVSNQAATATIRLRSIFIVRSTMIAARRLPADPCDLM